MNSIKYDLFLNVTSYFIMCSTMFIYSQIDYHNIIKHAVISEAVLIERFKASYIYSYRTMSEEYEGSIPITKNVSIGDTIMIAYDQWKNKKSRAIRLRKGKATISTEYNKYVIVNNKTKDEKKEIADKLMTELKERYHVNE